MRTLKCTVVLLAMVFLFGCTMSGASVPEISEKPILTLEKFGEQWKIIVDRYIRALPNTPEARLTCFQKLIAKGLEDCLDDRYSHYLPKEKVAMFYEELKGSYAGVGLGLSDTDSQVTVVSIIEDSPAQESGKFEVGDVIIEVDGLDVTKKPTAFIVGKVRGSVDTHVTLLVKRNDKKLDPITLTREYIVIHPVHAVDIGEDITYIKIDQFNELTPGEFMHEMAQRLLVELPNNMWALNFNAKKFIIDLRQNPGGLVEAVGMMSYLFANGKEDIVLTMQSRKGEEIYHAGDYVSPMTSIQAGIFRDAEMIVMINGGSGSASEIFAQFLHEAMGVARVGTHSFGKGSVQEMIPLGHEDALYLTIAEYFVGKNKTPINKIGIQPEYEVKDVVPAKKNSDKVLVDPANDLQLKKAIELLRMLHN